MMTDLVTAGLVSSVSSDVVVALLRGMGSSELHQKFNNTSEGIRARKARLIWYTTGAITLCVAVAITLFGLLAFRWPPGVTAATGLSGAALALCFFLIGRAVYLAPFRSFAPQAVLDIRQKYDDEQARLAKDTTLPALLSFNREQMARYHQIATAQARVAARNSQIAMTIGFAALIGGAVTAIVTNDTITKLVIGGLASLGGIFSGYITRTFFVAQDKAIGQLFKYWEQPLATSYFLTAERILTSSFPEPGGVRDKELTKLLAQLLKVAAARDVVLSDAASGSKTKATQPDAGGT